MKISQLSLIAIAMLTSLCACSVESHMDDALSPLKNLPQPQKPTPAASKIDGNWKADCTAQEGFYLVETLKLDNGKVAIHDELFQSSTCTGTPVFKVDLDGNYVIGASSASVNGGTDVDMTLKDPNTGELKKYMFVVVVEGTKMYLPPIDHDSSVSRATTVDRARPYNKF